MADAKRHGLLEPSPKTVQIDLGIPVFAETPAQNVIRLYLPLHNPVSTEFSLTDNRFWKIIDISIVFKTIKFGSRPYFICPLLKRPCLKLYILGGAISSKEGFHCARSASEGPLTPKIYPSDIETRARYLGLRERTRLSPERRVAIAERARILAQKDLELSQRFREEQSSEVVQRQRFYWESRELSTTKALDDGRGMAESEPYNALANRDMSWFDNPTPHVHIAPSGMSGLVTEFGELDIRVLLSRHIFASDRLTGLLMGWPFSRLWKTAIIMFVCPRDDALPQLIMEVRVDGAEPVYQEVSLMCGHRSGGPRHFVCPATRLPTDVLYFREGFFASRQAHSLSYPAGGKKKLIQRMIPENEKLSPPSR